MKKLIITGAPRTGTTALATLLSQSSDILVMNELAIFDNNPVNFWKKRNNPVEGRDIKNNKLLEAKGLSIKDVDDFFAGNFSNKGNLEFFGDKFPTYCTSFEYCKHLAKKHSDAFYIFTYRDPCAVVSSFIKRTRFCDEKNADWHFNNIKEAVEKIITYSYHWSKDIYPYVDNKFIVNYDFFINRPSFLLKELSKFLGLDIIIQDPEKIEGHTEVFDTGFRSLYEHSKPDEYKDSLKIEEINYIRRETARIDLFIKSLIADQFGV